MQDIYDHIVGFFIQEVRRAESWVDLVPIGLVIFLLILFLIGVTLAIAFALSDAGISGSTMFVAFYAYPHTIYRSWRSRRRLKRDHKRRFALAEPHFPRAVWGIATQNSVECIARCLETGIAAWLSRVSEIREGAVILVNVERSSLPWMVSLPPEIVQVIMDNWKTLLSVPNLEFESQRTRYESAARTYESDRQSYISQTGLEWHEVLEWAARDDEARSRGEPGTYDQPPQPPPEPVSPTPPSRSCDFWSEGWRKWIETLTSDTYRQKLAEVQETHGDDEKIAVR